jgi:hypothetical protein
MPKSLPRLIPGLAFLLFVTAPVLADTQFRVRRMTRTDVPLGKGQCDIRLRVDNEAEVSVRGDMVYVRTISGRDARDDGSECNEPLPARGVSSFNFEVRDRRGDLALLSEPTQRSGYRAVVRIRDSESGEGRYHFRLSWQMDGGGSYPDDRRRGDYGDGRRGGFGEDRRGDYGDDRRGGGSQMGYAIDACRDAASDRIAREYRYSDVDILNIRADNGPGRNDYVVGEAAAGRGRNAETFSFACQVDLNSGRVRNVTVRRR